jgi:hypothetical protein
MAAPTAEDKPFKFGLKVKGETLFLTSSGNGSKSKADAVDCTISGGKIACGADKGGIGTMMHGKMTPSRAASNNKGWAIGAGNQITYSPSGTAFNIALRNRNELWVENCDMHPDGSSFTKGKAEAVYE